MKKKVLFLIVIILGIAGLGGYKILATNAMSSSGLKVISDPSASIFLNDKLIGKTPYEEKHPPGEYTLKLIPVEATSQASSWQGKIKLNQSVLTYVNRYLGASELTSAGEVLTLEKINNNQVQIAVNTQPDGVNVILDGIEKGPAPQLIKDVSPNEHDVAVVATGFAGRTVRVQTALGYKLSIAFQLALVSGNEATQSMNLPQLSETETEENNGNESFIIIKDTPTGFLRVRSGPSTSASEITQVKPGEKYKIVEEKEGWYKILIDEEKEGWISAKYTKKEGVD